MGKAVTDVVENKDGVRSWQCGSGGRGEVA